MKDFTSRVYKLLSSTFLFRIILVFFILEAVWIALSATYPQAFDENFHFGLIQIYSHYWLPFLSSQPAHANAYGAVARDPSYMYHYLMSFPYRIIARFDHEMIGQVIMLRFINIGFFAIGIALFHRILRRVGISKQLANISILIFALIPIVPQLAAQINYDNLLLPLIAWVILVTFNATYQLRQHKPSAKTFMGLLSLCLFTSLVKYAFLPIFLGVIIFLSIVAYRSYKHKTRELFKQLNLNWKQLSKKMKLLLAVILILTVGMFIQRDGVNLIKYHAIEPNCSSVLSVNDCKAYSPWEYNYQNHLILEKNLKSGTASRGNPLYYTGQWIYWMWYRLFFAVNGPVSSFTNYPPLPLPSAAAIVIAGLGSILFIKYWRMIFKDNIYLVLIFLVSLLYILALFVQGYSTYHYTNILENMNGRYLLPVLLLVAAVFGRAFSIALGKSRNVKTLLVCAILLLFLQGGGILTFIARSDDTWDLHNTTVKKVNDTARKITNPIIINGKKQYTTSYWFFN